MVSARGQIVALGGGGFSMEVNPALDDFILGLARSPCPRICFVPTASGDNENYVVRFYKRFSTAQCRPTHLELFRRSVTDLAAFAKEQDVIFVGGGNTANMLAVWRLHDFDGALRGALESGSLLAGISAGSICWFEQGITDSFGPELNPLAGLGFLPGSNCPHYDGEPKRRPAYHAQVLAGMKAGYAADDGVALHFVDGSLADVVSSRPGASAYRVEAVGGQIVETPIAARRIGEAEP
ncbi:MAG: peptidase E [Polyangiaceae bacterium]|nr:peptidase E [Polyangiaceae bacterium]